MEQGGSQPCSSVPGGAEPPNAALDTAAYLQPQDTGLTCHIVTADNDQLNKQETPRFIMHCEFGFMSIRKKSGSNSVKVLMQAEKPVEQYTDMTSVAYAAIMCFLPTGIVAAVYSCMGDWKFRKGDLVAANKYTDCALYWSCASYGLGTIGLIVGLAFIIYYSTL